MNQQTQKILQDKADEKYQYKVFHGSLAEHKELDRITDKERKAYLAGCSDFIDACLKLIEWIAANYTDVNVMVDHPAVWECSNTKEKFTTEQLLDYYLQNIYYNGK